jgi:hypothetical protein
MLNGGMTPWDYYMGATQNAQQNALLAARMQQFRTQQIRRQLMADAAAQMLPQRMRLLQGQAGRAATPGARGAGLSLPGGGAPALPPATASQPGAAGPDPFAVLTQARAALGKGAPRGKVVQRLQAMGIDHTALDALDPTAILPGVQGLPAPALPDATVPAPASSQTAPEAVGAVDDDDDDGDDQSTSATAGQ